MQCELQPDYVSAANLLLLINDDPDLLHRNYSVKYIKKYNINNKLIKKLIIRVGKNKIKVSGINKNK